MSSTKVQLIGGPVLDAMGNVTANGYIEMVLAQDAAVPGVGIVGAGKTVTIQLDSDGEVSTSPAQYVWGNDILQPVNSYYKVTAYTAEGQPVWGPNNQQVIGSPTFDIGSWIPNQIYSWTPPNNTGSPAGLATSLTTAILASGAIENDNVVMAKTVSIRGLTVSSAARVRVYGSSWARLADASRPTNVPPTAGLANGIIGDWVIAQPNAWSGSQNTPGGTLITDSNGNIQLAIVGGMTGGSPPTWNAIAGQTTVDNAVTWLCQGSEIPFFASPVAVGSNIDSPQSAILYLAVTNFAGTSEAVTVTLNYVPMES